MAEKSHKELSCPICLEILKEPSKITCGHAFCRACITSISDTSAECPVCREKFNLRSIRGDSALRRKVNTAEITCPNCQQQMPAKNLREHEKTCQPETVTFDPSAYSQHAPKVVPNRSTFICPYCEETNLACDDLVKHCNKKHRHDKKQVVCPVCASMPWGDDQLVSSNFIEHLNRRHKFEYDTYVDYSQGDDEMLQAALQASMLEK